MYAHFTVLLTLYFPNVVWLAVTAKPANVSYVKMMLVSAKARDIVSM